MIEPSAEERQLREEERLAKIQQQRDNDARNMEKEVSRLRIYIATGQWPERSEA